MAVFCDIQCFDKMQNSLFSAFGEKIMSQQYTEVLRHPVLKLYSEMFLQDNVSSYRVGGKGMSLLVKSRINFGDAVEYVLLNTQLKFGIM